MSRLGDRNLVYDSHSLSHRIISIFVLIGIVILALTFLILYGNESRSVQNEHALIQNYTEQDIRIAVGLLLEREHALDLLYQLSIQGSLQVLYDEYKKTGSHAEQLDLNRIKTELETVSGLSLDFYILDHTGTMHYSTDPHNPPFNLSIPFQIPQSPGLSTVLIDTNISSGGSEKITRSGYLSIGGDPSVLAVRLTPPKEITWDTALRQKISDDFSRRVPGIRSIHIFDTSVISGRWVPTDTELLSVYGVSSSEYPDRISTLKQVFETGSDHLVFKSESFEYRKYLYVTPTFSNTTPSPDGGRVIEITYSSHSLQEQQMAVLVKYLMGGVLCMVSLIIGALLITRYITQPVELIIRDIEQISEGAYDHAIRHTHGYEFDRLEASIGKMVSRLKDDIIAIRKKSEELDHELHMRTATERSLRSANQKLNLLGTITRHDILNQLTVITGALDLIEGEGVRDPEHTRLYDLIHRSVVTIHKQISFTRVYEQMGTEDPVWSFTANIVNKATDEINLAGVEIEDKTGSLEILTDPMIDRVIFNLMENAIRHGSHVTKITLVFRPQGDHGQLLIQDNGRGVVAGEKEKIFDRGYGSNTGLGLFLVREILAITGFSIRETGTPGEGACFCIEIPPGYWRLSHE